METNTLRQLDREEAWMEAVPPPVNIEEREDAVILEAEMPGLRQDEIHLDLEGEALTLSGCPDESHPQGATILLRERTPVHYRRTFLIGPELDRTQISASYENGVVRVVVPKVEAAKPHRIPIN